MNLETVDRILERVMVVLIFASGMCLAFFGLGLMCKLLSGCEHKSVCKSCGGDSVRMTLRYCEKCMVAWNDGTDAASLGILYKLKPVMPDGDSADAHFNDGERHKSNVGHDNGTTSADAGIIGDSNCRNRRVMLFKPSDGTEGEVRGNACGKSSDDAATGHDPLQDAFHGTHYTKIEEAVK